MTPEAGAGRRRTAAAATVFAAVVVALFWHVWIAGIHRAAPMVTHHVDTDLVPGEETVLRSDLMFVVAIVAHDARSLLRSPQRVFETLHCAPVEKGLALSEPMLTLGLLAAPVRLLPLNPIVTYNVALMVLLFITAMAMYVLIRDWSGSHVAALAAGLLYAFDAPRLTDIVHPFVYDTAWSVFALFFARRLLAEGSWRDAVGLATCGAIQLGTSLYPTLGALLVLLPCGAVLVWQYGLRRVRPAQLGLVAAVVLGTAWFVYSPFLEIRSDVLVERETQYFANWRSLLPGGSIGMAFVALSLALFALVRPLRLAGDTSPAGVRWALLAGGLLSAFACTGPNQLPGVPDLYALLAAVVPGLENVRAPVRVATGFHLAVCVLAGMGAASGLQRLRERPRRNAEWILLVAVAFEVLVVPPLRTGAATHFGASEIAPPRDALYFYEKLAEEGNTGPILEVPNLRMYDETPRILLAQYHGRRTSACAASYVPEVSARIQQYAEGLPDRSSIDGLRALGFTTVVIRHWPEYQNEWREWVLRVTGLPLVHVGSNRFAYALEP